METLRTKAIEIIGSENVRKLEESGLFIAIKPKPPRYRRYYKTDVKIIGHITMKDTGDTFPYIDFDFNGFEYICDEEDLYCWTHWIGSSSVERM